MPWISPVQIPHVTRLVLGGHLKAGPLWPSELATFEGGHRGSGFHGTKRHLDESRGVEGQQAKLRVLVFTIDHSRQGFIHI